ncbi:MAG: hypothetical protein ACJA16_005689, partial [Akkermansiaceae bacterium]
MNDLVGGPQRTRRVTGAWLISGRVLRPLWMKKGTLISERLLEVGCSNFWFYLEVSFMRMRAKTLSPTMTRRVRIPVPDAPSPLEGISARGPVGA